MALWPFKRRKPRTRVVRIPLRARYDAVQNTPDNRKHWANADSLSAAAALTPDVRAALRNRGRYEVANNSYARGIVETLANDTIGRGPRLQMLTADPKFNEMAERRFADWARAVRLAEKLRTMRIARAQDGEAFGILVNNPAIGATESLDLRLIEAEMVARPVTDLTWSDLADGIDYDADGNPLSYTISKSHPGGLTLPASMDDSMKVDAGSVIHWYRVDRPGQLRGAPDICPALPLFAQLRRYTMAVIGSAEIAAEMAVIMKTQTPPDAGAADVDPATEMEWAFNQMTFVPEGWEPYQMKAEQPATTYPMFKREILTEIARCLNMPYNVAACDSSEYNYASGRLDHQTYFRSIAVDQAHVESIILDPLLAAWLAEAFGQRGAGKEHQWFWPGREHVDPAKEANAQAVRLKNLTTTHANEFALQGRDWEAEMLQLAKERALMKKLGLSMADEPVKEDEDGEDEEEAPARGRQ